MGSNRRKHQNKKKVKISIAKRLGAEEKDIFDAMKTFYTIIEKTDCIIILNSTAYYFL